MRLSEEEIGVKDSVERLDREAELYLFGSRLDDRARGGDIALLIRSQKLGRKELRRIRLDFFARFGEQKLDLILDDGHNDDPFIRLVNPEIQKL
jgi:predicted nucleotidyltransferase